MTISEDWLLYYRSDPFVTDGDNVSINDDEWSFLGLTCERYSGDQVVDYIELSNQLFTGMAVSYQEH